MAPEVGLNKPYNLKADVYSWSMLFWYIMALEPPMASYTPPMFIERVFTKGVRPSINTKWSRKIQRILKCSWNGNIDQRMNFHEIISILQDEIHVSDSSVEFTNVTAATTIFNYNDSNSNLNNNDIPIIKQGCTNNHHHNINEATTEGESVASTHHVERII